MLPQPPSSTFPAQIQPILRSRVVYPNVRSLRSNVRSFLANVRSSPANVRSSASNRSQELRTSTRHRVAAGTVGERASARPLTHQKPFLDRAAKSHGDVVPVLFRHLFEPAFTHPREGGDDPLLREMLTLAEGAHSAPAPAGRPRESRPRGRSCRGRSPPPRPRGRRPCPCRPGRTGSVWRPRCRGNWRT